MIEWISCNIGTIVAIIVLICAVGGIIAVMIRDKKKGKSSCGCNCAHCAMSGTCHKNK